MIAFNCRERLTCRGDVASCGDNAGCGDMARDGLNVRFPLLSGAFCAAALFASDARAQAWLPFTGFGPLPSFAWSEPALSPRWDGSYARISTGFHVSSSKRMGTSAGPTFGLEAGTMRQEGNFVYGIVGALEYMPAFGGYGTPGFGQVGYTRDFAGAFQIKTGVLVTPDVLLYTKVGMAAANETLRYGATPWSAPFNRSDILVRPEARAGVEWAVTNNLTLGLEVGVVGQAIR
jgi:outer membrane immunogenic protein